MKKVDALDQFNKSGMSYSDMMKNCQIYSAGIRTEETLLAKNLYEKLRKLKMLDQLKQEAITKRDGEQQ
ncbi:hypothetical protein LDY14_04545 [Acinetobacter baumannii]|uniref:hypothetical protein n=1 Tax=Acinetobacter baumannii TaxID=470 RepID=UPI001CDD1DE0|nr:hypothetical protein [Acinetobacter baumannii]MCA4179790.1 hypothetical protein [Acinetobacter baumannii]